MDGLQNTNHNIQPPKLLNSCIDSISHVRLLPNISLDSQNLNIRVSFLDQSGAFLGSYDVDVN